MGEILWPDSRRIAVMRDDLPFNEAFGAAREAGAEGFDWQGTRYHIKRYNTVADAKRPLIVRWYVEERAGASVG